MARPKKSIAKTTENYLARVEGEIQSNQSKLNMVLGALIVLVVGILIFNYFNKSRPDLGPAQSTTSTDQQDVAPGNLPGKYTVKEGDTLFDIANTYYNDGYQYSEIVKTNNLTNPDTIETGQVLDIPKLENAILTPVMQTTDTEWGLKITENTYTVQEGDWLSTIAGRAYGDIYAYSKIAQANNIPDPDNIEVGTVLTIPR